MAGIEQIKEDVHSGRMNVEQLLNLVRQLQQALDAANRRIAELEKRLGESGTTKCAESFSVRAEEQRQKLRGKKPKKQKRTGRRGRVTTAEKVQQASRIEKVFPIGVPKKDCRLSHTRPMWRLENGRAILIAYEVYCGPKKQYGQIPGALGRTEFGTEIIIAIAYQVYVLGLSFDKTCQVLAFFQNLRLRKSQADALMRQLARHWTEEFEHLCTLLANSAVVHADETSWSIHSVWAFVSEKVRMLFYGVHKNAATLQAILDPATFTGIVVSDDAAVYANFTQSQKCWAHLLRKAIKLTLMEPANTEFRQFADRLLDIYHEACRIQRDKRLGDDGRARKVAALDDQIFDLCNEVWAADLPPLKGAADDERLLVNELMRLMIAEQLFTFVTAKPVTMPNGHSSAVAGTNNESERTLRGPANARETGRTNKTSSGARRQTIIVSVLESLRNHLATFTLATVIDEIARWGQTGRSCFAELADHLGKPAPETSVLDRIHPRPSG